MKLVVSVENMSADAETSILHDIKSLVLDYSVEGGLKKNVKVLEEEEVK